jgi:hypothetical protein
MRERIRELDGGQEILTQKIDRLERALTKLVDGVAYNPVFAAECASEILSSTFPI